MARRSLALRLLAWSAGGFVLALTLGSLIPLLWISGGISFTLGTADLAVLQFTVLQAVLSACLAGVLAVPLARALARRQFWGRGLIMTLLGAPFLVPVLVAVIGMLTVWGRSGWISSATGQTLDIYGLSGILLAHVFFNLPLITRILLTGWAAVPIEQFRLAAQLGFGPMHIFRHIEWPMLREVLPGALLLVFLLCLTSFSVALTLGGGPRATTLEMAIYQALRFEFDLTRAAFLSVLQIGIALSAAILLLLSSRERQNGASLLSAQRHIPVIGDTSGRKFRDSAIIIISLGFLALPLVAIILKGLPGLAGLDARIWPALFRSVGVALISAIIAVALALPIAWVVTEQLKPRAILAEAIVLVGLTASPLVIGTALFIVLRGYFDPFGLALPLTALVNGVLAVAFALRILVPDIARLRRQSEALSQSIGLSRRLWLKRVALPEIRRALGLALGLTAAFSMGDLGIIALFGSSATETLPLLMFSLIGAYRLEAALGVGLVMTCLTLALFALFDLWGRRDA